jgi:hypothetical protein
VGPGATGPDTAEAAGAVLIAALYVNARGVYSAFPGVDCWGIERDAMRYGGPHPVVAHPPCTRWCCLAPQVQHRFPDRADLAVGNDGGTFAHALACVRRFGGVLEHPAKSLAWRAHGLMPPVSRNGGGWQLADSEGGWTCHVEQRHYGHRARKATWLYAVGVELPSLRWGPCPPGIRVAGDGYHSREERKAPHRVAGGVERQGKHEREATPPAFAAMLVAMARTARR